MANFSIEPNERVAFKVRHADDDVLVIEKPAHIVSTPGAGHERGSLLNGLFATYGKQLQNLGKDRDFGMLHRLDRETSGLLIVALRAVAYDKLRSMFETRAIRKFYFAVVAGVPNQTSGVIRRPINEVRETRDRREMKIAKISGSGKPATTAYRVLDASAAASFLECRAVSGRLHQLRVHLESIRCPIFGDDLYAPPAIAKGSPRLALHAHRVAFTHPVTGLTLDVLSPMPADIKRLVTKLGMDPKKASAAKEPAAKAAGNDADLE
ncbi:MAG: RluA family pseudouridine synthase [Phycisphaeraceae bacterium]|nr:RluA family pseudouridine synthase [Phycisphaeraceae bacterium]